MHYTLLLVDMSGSVSESGNGGHARRRPSGTFTDRVEKQQKVGIYAFDGSPDLYPIVPFTDQPGSAKAGVQQLATFKPKDPSTNLNGAVVKALDELDNALGKATQPLKFGTLVVFTDGTDRANRVPADDMQQHIKREAVRRLRHRPRRRDQAAAARGHRQERHRDGGGQDRHRQGVRRRRREGRGAHEELLPALLLLAVARRQARGPHRGGRQGRPERQRAHREPQERLRRDGLRAGLRSEHAAELRRHQGRRARRRRRRQGQGRRRKRRTRRTKKEKGREAARRRSSAGSRRRRPPAQRRRRRRPRPRACARRRAADAPAAATSTRSGAGSASRIALGDRVGGDLREQDAVAVVARREEQPRQRRGAHERASPSACGRKLLHVPASCAAPSDGTHASAPPRIACTPAAVTSLRKPACSIVDPQRTRPSPRGTTYAPAPKTIVRSARRPLVEQHHLPAHGAHRGQRGGHARHERRPAPRREHGRVGARARRRRARRRRSGRARRAAARTVAPERTVIRAAAARGGDHERAQQRRRIDLRVVGEVRRRDDVAARAPARLARAPRPSRSSARSPRARCHATSRASSSRCCLGERDAQHARDAVADVDPRRSRGAPRPTAPTRRARARRGRRRRRRALARGARPARRGCPPPRSRPRPRAPRARARRRRRRARRARARSRSPSRRRRQWRPSRRA